MKKEREQKEKEKEEEAMKEYQMVQFLKSNLSKASPSPKEIAK